MDILNYNYKPFGGSYTKEGEWFLASGSKIYPYFIEVHYNKEGKAFEVAIVNIKSKLGL